MILPISMKKLSTLHTSIPHRIEKVDDSELKHRLYELGIFPNQTLQVVKRAPLGDPMMVSVEGQLVMLRLSEANLITIQEK